MLTFGKYKNEPLIDVYKKDEKYLKWLHTQPWFRIKFKDLHNQTTCLLNEKKEPIQIESNSFVIYTDGACKNNGTHRRDHARGGIGIHFSPKNNIKIDDISVCLDVDKPTNNIAELMAIEMALKTCIQNNIKDKIIIFTDSQYSLKSITLWYPDWVNKNKLQGKKNIDILERIHQLTKQVNIKFEYIRAHTNLSDEHSVGNSMADQLATQCIKYESD